MKNILLVLLSLSLVGCATARLPLKTAESVDLQKFSGSWYVIACIPTFIETHAYNEIETYHLLPNGVMDTYLTFNQGGFDGPVKQFNPHGYVKDQINHSTWAMQFIWPFKAEYLITYLKNDYSQTIVGRNKRDYFWIMSRTPTIPEADYESLLNELSDEGYDIKKVRKVPQKYNQR